MFWISCFSQGQGAMDDQLKSHAHQEARRARLRAGQSLQCESPSDPLTRILPVCLGGESWGVCPTPGFPLFYLFLFYPSSYPSSLCYRLSSNYDSVPGILLAMKITDTAPGLMKIV